MPQSTQSNHKPLIAALIAAMVLALTVNPAAGALFAVTGDGATEPETLYTLSQSDATATFARVLGNGSAGEAIGFNSDDGLIYHFSGSGSPADLNTPGASIMESINPVTLAVAQINIQGTGFNANNVFRSDEIRSIAADPASGDLYVTARDDFYRVTTAGVATHIGSTWDWFTLAFAGATLYALDYSNNPHTPPELRVIDPTDGSFTSNIVVTLAGVNVDKGLGLATDPDTGTLWAILQDAGLDRRLVTIDSNTGVATEIGILSDRIASIAFAPVPEPSALALLAIGCAGCFGRRARRV